MPYVEEGLGPFEKLGYKGSFNSFRLNLFFIKLLELSSDLVNDVFNISLDS